MKNFKYLSMIHIAVLLFGLAGVIGKSLTTPAVIITFGRVFSSSLVLLLVIFTGKKSLALKNQKDLVYFLLAGIVMAVHWISFIQSIQLSSVAIGTITYSTFPLFVTFLEPLLFHERLQFRNILTALIMLAGVFVLVPTGNENAGILSGILCGMCSSLTYAVLSLLNRRLTATYEGTIVCFYEQSIACVFLLPSIFLMSFTVGMKEILLITVLGIICTAVAHTLFVSSLKGLKVQTAGIISGMESVYGIILATVILHDIPSRRELLGGCIILAVTLYTTQTSKNA